ncbi:MAG: hypothetical protein PCFJNLEI_01366 [Verrucomicrobiae bacterium]|nr:hypothetical protein [Verrucomicrobiae bacterium]
MIMMGGERFTVFALDDIQEIQRAQRVAWEDYEMFLQTITQLKDSPLRHRLGA